VSNVLTPASSHSSPVARCQFCGYSRAGLAGADRCPECGRAFGSLAPREDPRAALSDAAASLAIGLVCVPLIFLPCVDFVLPFISVGFGVLSLWRTVRSRRFVSWPPVIASAGIVVALVAFAGKLAVVFGLTLLLAG